RVVLRLYEDDHDGRPREPARKRAESGDSILAFFRLHHDEAVRFTVLRRWRHAPGLQDSSKRLGGYRAVQKRAPVALTDRAFVEVHGRILGQSSGAFDRHSGCIDAPLRVGKTREALTFEIVI